MKYKISESIFSNNNIVIPMADVSFIEKHYYGVPSQYGGIKIIMKNTFWDMKADTWANNAFISKIDNKDKKFLEAWCYYRYEIEGGEETFKNPSDNMEAKK